MSVHVSGCTKGCARRRPATLTLVAEAGRYGLAFASDARAPSETPLMTPAEMATTSRGLDRAHTPPCREPRACLSATTSGTAPRSTAAPSPPSAREADLSRFAPEEVPIVVRIIHACGMVEIAADVAMAPGLVASARAALRAGAPILCDSRMVANGVTRARLPAGNEVVCTLDDPLTPGLARDLGNTRTAAAIDLWGERLGGSVVAIGNAPTALFRLMDLIDAGAPASGRHHRHPRRLRRRHRIEGGARRLEQGALARRTWPQGRQRHGGGGHQRPCLRGGVMGAGLRGAASTASASVPAIPN